LHGRGESGRDLARVKLHGIARVIDEMDEPATDVRAAGFPAVAVSPQCPDETDWEEQSGAVWSLIQEVCEAHPIDRRRIYLTGLSMGGRGSWKLAVEHPDAFAAIAPICGRIPRVDGFLTKVQVLKDVPIWVFHGVLDPIVPVDNSDRIVASLTAAGADVRYTRYPDADHDAWTRTYADPAFYTWLWGKTR
jgi:predicted peptidase